MSLRRSDRRESSLPDERNELAWTRTALALLVTAALVVRAGLMAGNRPLEVVGWVLVATAGALWALARHRHSATRTVDPAGRRTAHRAHLALVAGATTVGALSVLVAVVLSGSADG